MTLLQLTLSRFQSPLWVTGLCSSIVYVPGARSTGDGVALTGTFSSVVVAVTVWTAPPPTGVTSKVNRPTPPCVILRIVSPPGGGTYWLVYVHVTWSSAARSMVAVVPLYVDLLVPLALAQSSEARV